MSLDALRGFDMFWILGADSIVYALRQLRPGPVTGTLAEQLEHADWAGFHAYDLIFPLFVFIVGVASVFSLRRTVAEKGRAVAARRVLVRAAVLFILGIFYNGGLSAAWPDVRLVGVLQRIGLAYAGAGLLFIFFRPRILAAMAVAILGVYWALLTFTPIRALQLQPEALAQVLGPDPTPGPNEQPSTEYRTRVETQFEATDEWVTGKFEPGLNVPNHFDFQHLPGFMYDRYWDPEGVLSNLPAVATALAGMLAGVLLTSGIGERRKLLWLVAGGAACLVVGYAWGVQFPVIKKIWTSTFVLVAAGWSTLLLALFYYLVDLRGWRRWCTPFIWIGMNPITLYLASSVIGFHAIARRLAGGSVHAWLNSVATGFGDLLLAAISLGLILALARFLYRRQIFLKV